jgi:hypothetical protein
MLQIENEFKDYVDFLNQHGFEDKSLEIILRDRKDNHMFFSNVDAINFPKGLEGFKPFGNPPPFLFGYSYTSDNIFSSIFVAAGEAIHLSLVTDRGKKVTHPLLLLDIIKSSMQKILAKVKSNDESIKFDVEVLNPTFYDEFQDLKDVGSIIFNILAGFPTLIIGNSTKAVQMIQSIIQVIPKEYQQFIGVTVNIPYQSNENINLAVLDKTEIEEFNDKIDEFLSNGYDIVNLNKKESFCQFISSATIKITELINTMKLEEAEKMISDLIDLAKQIEKNEESTELANRLNIEFDNADLIIAMKENFQL